MHLYYYIQGLLKHFFKTFTFLSKLFLLNSKVKKKILLVFSFLREVSTFHYIKPASSCTSKPFSRISLCLVGRWIWRNL